MGDIISGVGFGIFGQGHIALGPNHKSQAFDSSFYWKLVFKALDWLSSISGSKVIAQRTKPNLFFLPKFCFLFAITFEPRV